MKRRTVAVDMDGVLHAYRRGWEGEHVLNDEAVPGAMEWLAQITESYDVAILSTRCRTVEGRWAMLVWLAEQGVGEQALRRISAPEHKVPALLYVDDRGWRFTGANFPTAREVAAARPWWHDVRE